MDDLDAKIRKTEAFIRGAAPPDIKLINELLSFDTVEDSLAAAKNRAAEITPQVVAAMKEVEAELQASDRKEVADRLGKIRAVAEREAMMAKWR